MHKCNKMEQKARILNKICMARRFLITAKITEDAGSCSSVVNHLQEKQLQLLKELHMSLALASERRLASKKERTQSSLELDFLRCDEATFKNNFRMSRRLFYELCQMLTKLKKNDTNMRKAIPLEKRVAIALYALGSCANYRTIANMFSVGKSTVCNILLSFCSEVWRVLAPIYLNNFPMTREKIENLVQEFETLGFPQCMGAIDCCHIEIHPCMEDAKKYFNYKEWYSIVLLALVDARCRFIYVSSGSPGRSNDSQIFQTSSLKQQLDQCVLLNDLSRRISDVDVPVFIIGDSAFRLSEKLMKPYPLYVSQSRQQKEYNLALYKARSVVDNAFNFLKARFRHIGKGIDNNVRNANAIILSCCVLHNFLIENNDTINKNWMQALKVEEANRSYPEYNASSTEQSNNPERIRSAISKFLSLGDGAGDESSLILDDGSGVVANTSGEDGHENMVFDDDSNGETLGTLGEGSDEVIIEDDGSTNTFEFMS